DLMRLSGYRLPNQSDQRSPGRVSAAIFADLTDDEREELVEYLAWYRARQRSRGHGKPSRKRAGQ
ncbi:MAG TPA: hypothetical protein VK736_07000, partial [Candidatus Binatia bacterium]|nr:hypothetical protein [Candidatus Binatia bacterium]